MVFQNNILFDECIYLNAQMLGSKILNVTFIFELIK